MKALIRKASIRGEWWIDESGNAMFADGDVGDMNHEAYVIQQVQRTYVSDEFDRGEYIDWEGFKQSLASEKAQESYANPAVMQQILQSQNIPVTGQITPQYFLSNIDLDELANELLLELGMSEEEIMLAEGRGDARLYGMQKWGWKRVLNENVETWTLNSKDLNTIASGLYDAYQDGAETGRFNIYVFSTETWFRNVPYVVISSGKVAALRQFNSQMSGIR